jgi:CTP:molybdopterin cytidylyltransferase MocA
MIAVVLAAGRGDRLGGPKALLAWPGDEGELPLAAAHARARKADCEKTLVVTRDDIAARLASWLAPDELLISTAPDAQGPAGSLAAAAATLTSIDDNELVLVTLVDLPPARTATVNALVTAVEPGIDAARPSHQSRRGHPVLLRAALLERYRVPSPPPLRELLRELGPRVAEVVVDDASVVVDFNTAADLAPYAGEVRFF